jgi:hypothetical protein
MVTTKGETLEIKKLAEKYGITYEDASKVIQSQYDFIRDNLKALKLPLDLSEEEFHKTTKNYNIPALGKLYASWLIYKKINKL